MDDNKLAIEVCDLGIGNQGLPISDNAYYFGNRRLTAEEFVRNWPVAGALMGKVKEREWLIQTMHDGYVYIFTEGGEHVSDSTEWPRAIIEASVKALTTGNTTPESRDGDRQT